MLKKGDIIINDNRKIKIKKLKVSLAKLEEEEVKISSEFIKLDSALKLIGIAQTGGHAKILVLDGDIRVNGEVCKQRGKKLRNGDSLQYGRNIYNIVSSFGDKNDN